MNNSPEPDSFEKRLRFGCGFTFGGFVAFFVALREFAAYTDTLWAFGAIVAGVAIIFGFLAVRYGNEFWHGVSNWFRSW